MIINSFSQLNGYTKYQGNVYGANRISPNVQPQSSRPQEMLPNQIRPNKINLDIYNLTNYNNLHIHNQNRVPISIPAPNTRRQSYYEEKSNYCSYPNFNFS